jgi:GTP-binding protein HflX
MSKKTPEETGKIKERAILVGVDIYDQQTWLSFDDSLDELYLLAETAGVEVVGETTQSLSKPYSDTYIGSGKVEEIKILVSETDANIIIFDNELSPRHQRELEKRIASGVRVLDRTALILDIFAQHANTKEGILQVELAQYEYLLPRLTRAWTHLERQAGGGGGRAGSVGGVGLRGPGETQLEVDRREIRKKISNLKSELEKVRSHRSRHRDQRKRSQIPTVALVGYTNAGKSTLLNYLTDANVFVANQLFATLDPTTRRVNLPEGHTCLFTDTVGFIQKLPTQLIAAFRATLEEINEADLLLHVVDISHPNAYPQWQAVLDTLKELGAENIPTITVLNKSDKLDQSQNLRPLIEKYDDPIIISALNGDGIDLLLNSIESRLFLNNVPVVIELEYNEGKLLALFHEHGVIDKINHKKKSVWIEGSIPAFYLPLFEPFFAGDFSEDEVDDVTEDEEHSNNS